MYSVLFLLQILWTVWIDGCSKRLFPIQPVVPSFDQWIDHLRRLSGAGHASKTGGALQGSRPATEGDALRGRHYTGMSRPVEAERPARPRHVPHVRHSSWHAICLRKYSISTTILTHYSEVLYLSTYLRTGYQLSRELRTAMIRVRFLGLGELPSSEWFLPSGHRIMYSHDFDSACRRGIFFIWFKLLKLEIHHPARIAIYQLIPCETDYQPANPWVSISESVFSCSTTNCNK